MATYVMSDIHGHYREYLKMLKKINFNDDDTLYIIGDIIDRGKEPLMILLDMMKRPNIIPILGNHEVMAVNCFDFLLAEVTESAIDNLTEQNLRNLRLWAQNGGRKTLGDLYNCSYDTLLRVKEYLLSFNAYDEIKVNGVHYVMVHAGISRFKENKPLEDYSYEDFVWERTNYDMPYYKDKVVITGHTPTLHIECADRKGYIMIKNNHIAIDCGSYFEGGRLGCLRLDDMQEFYVETNEREGRVFYD